MKKGFKVLAVLCALSLVVGATVAITLALLTATSGSAVSNTFTGTAGLSVVLKETAWDNDTPADQTDGGEGKAANYSPGLVIEKDPLIQNTTTLKAGYENDSYEYAALKLEYQISDGSGGWETITYAQFQNLADVYCKVGGVISGSAGFNTADWEAKDASNTVWYYKTSVKGGLATAIDNKTTTLFDYVKINSTLTENTVFDCGIPAHVAAETHKGLIQFRINIKGYAVQTYENGADIGLVAAKGKLDSLITANP